MTLVAHDFQIDKALHEWMRNAQPQVRELGAIDWGIPRLTNDVRPGGDTSLPDFYLFHYSPWPSDAVFASREYSGTDTPSNLIASESLSQILREAENETFEHGMESEFSERFVNLFSQYSSSSVAVDAFTALYLSGTIAPLVLAEAFRWIGRMHDQNTHVARRQLLEKGLRHHFATVRDGALIGLALLDDPESSYAIQNAIESERVLGLREDMIALNDHFARSPEQPNSGLDSASS